MKKALSLPKKSQSMASVKIVVRRNKRKNNGTIPLAIRITKDRKSRFIFTGQYIDENHWNDQNCTVKKSHPNSSRLNYLLSQKLAEANEMLLEAEVSKSINTVDDIKKKIKNQAGGSFFEVAEERIRNKEAAGVFSVARAEASILNNIRKFHGKVNLDFPEITSSFLKRFKIFCKNELGQKSERTITNQLIFIRTVFNIAVKEGITKSEFYPFAGDKEKIRLKRGLKVGLSREEITRIENLELDEGGGIWHTRNVFLFSFYLAGIRISDVLKLKWSDIKDGRLFYVMEKNDKSGSLKIPVSAQKIICLYEHLKSGYEDFIFPDLKKADQSNPKDIFTKTRTATRRFNKYLKDIANLADIEKNLSNHISRHSFGNLAGDSIHPLMLQKLYRHSDLKTTINYQANFIHKEADEALDKVLNG